MTGHLAHTPRATFTPTESWGKKMRTSIPAHLANRPQLVSLPGLDIETPRDFHRVMAPYGGDLAATWTFP